ncbi:ribonuclease P protein component [Tsukamurella sp. 8F]|uniref:ribonuclease P protein component n=1 Tax=Tsukamurella sp. 8J TaxID=3031962 RepID=UPI0023B9D574|nr:MULTISPECIES: ribonuclease P protein component [unclassified Tsukamurella]MDF0529403.1 ribonuclease P protein component [Tsukamurella sp. 8J]MDF0587090.1 ribonuclease P protein component [Tsukamurella sp. 8F]
MLPARYRMSSARDFTAAVKSGRRAGRSALVVHIDDPTSECSSAPRPGSRVSGSRSVVPSASRAALGAPATWGGPRVGLIVSKAVGDAVTRHAVARRLRAAARTVVSEVDPGARVVIRALRPAADTDSNELAAQLRSSLRKLGAL